MSKITGSFIILVLVIFFSSIVYIWQADAEKNTLESQITSQEVQIAELKTQLDDLENIKSASNTINNGEVQGVTTATGIISGTITLSKNTTTEGNEQTNQADAVLVCANETRTKQETCLDFNIQTNQKKYDYEFDVPQGEYEIYAMTPPNETKVYYSDISTCDENGDCTTNSDKKRLLEVIQDEAQSDIDIYL
jgi:hypothetical protein